MVISDTFDCLRELPARRQVALCLAALGESHGGVQAAAVMALIDPVRLDRPDLVVDAFADLGIEGVVAARTAREVLLEIATERVRNAGTGERLPAIRVLAEFGDDADVIAPLRIAFGDEQQAIRDAAYEALVQRIRRLADATADREGAFRGAEAAVWEAFELLVDRLPEHSRQDCLELFAAFGRRAVVAVARRLRRASDLEPLLFEELQKAPHPAGADLALGLAAHSNEDVAEFGRRLLQERDDLPFQTRLAERLVGAAEESDVAVDGALFAAVLPEAMPGFTEAEAFAMLTDVGARAPDPLTHQRRVEAFLAHPAPAVQMRAIATLRELKCPGGCGALADLLRSAPDEVRLAGAELVSELAPAQAGELLTPLLAAEDDTVRARAAREVARVSLAKFLDRFEDMGRTARQTAAKAIRKIDGQVGQRLEAELQKLSGKRLINALQVVDLLGAGGELREPLLDLLDDADVRVRATAVRIVELGGSVAGVDVLSDLLADPDRRVRANTIEAVEQLGDPEWIGKLMPFLRDRDNRVRVNAAKALWNLGWSGAREALVEMLADPSPRLRVSAIWAIEQLAFDGAAGVLRNRVTRERDPAVRARLQAAIVEIESAPVEAG